MQLYGFALLPARRIQEKIINFQKEFQSEIKGPRLGLQKNLPHTSLLQHPYYPDIDMQRYLKNVNTAVFTTWNDAYYQPKGWIFAGVNFSTDMINHHYDLFSKTKHLIDTEQIDTSVDTGGLNDKEKNNYYKYGYRYLGSEFRPHVTLGITQNDNISQELINAFKEEFKGEPLFYDRIVYYKAGDHGACEQILAEKLLKD